MNDKMHPLTSVSRKAVGLITAGLLFAAMFAAGARAASYVGYTSLDPSQPITFDGNVVTWNGKTFTLGPKAIFLDYRLDPAQIAGNPYAFNTIQAAKAALTAGTAAQPMMLLTAPGVYWVDDPDDPAIRKGVNGAAPVGMTIACANLYFYGLNTVRDNVVFAVNRGQTQGAEGNFTMFTITGGGLRSENVTFGNYCNVDLEFPLAPELSRPRRAQAIAQAQLFNYDPNDGVAVNTAFISRLNLLPFATIYLNCHLESSGHATFHTTAMYINSSLEFYNSNFSAGRFFNCDIFITPFPNNYQGLSTYEFGFTDGTGSGGVLVDTRFHRSQELIDNNIAVEISWDRVPQSPTTRGYQFNVTLDGAPYRVQEYATPGASVIIADGSDQLKAFKVIQGGQTYYNIPNVLSGIDPFGYTPAIQAAAVAAGKPTTYYLRMPFSATLSLVSGSSSTIRSGQTTATLQYAVAPTAYASSTAVGPWNFTVSDPTMATVAPGTTGRIIVSGTNNTEIPRDVIVVAHNSLGVEAAFRITVEPSYVAPPTFVGEPVISEPNHGVVTLEYDLPLGSELRTDESNITWYRCTSPAGANPLKVAVTRFDEPERTYTLTEGDVGYYLMATIAPKHNRSDPGPTKTVYSSHLIQPQDIEVFSINTTFQNFPTDSQRSVLPGTWIVDGYFHPECVNSSGVPQYTANPNSWTYGGGEAGSIDYFGLNETARGARLAYVPAGSTYGDMAVSATFAPDKTAGQGFGSATQQFMEVYIKFDVVTQTGYGLRFQRLNPDDITAIGFNGDGAVAGVAAWLVKYTNGTITVISPKVMTSVFLSECTIQLETHDGRLEVTATSTADGVRSGDAFGYLREIAFDVPIAANSYGGTGMLFTGTVGANSVLVTHWATSWSPVPTDVSSRVSIVRGGFLRNRATGRYAQTVTVRNTGATAINGPLSLVLDGLPANAGLYAASGTTAVVAPLGSPYRDLNAGAEGVLSPGESVSLVLEFTNPSNGAISYSPRVLAGPGNR
ncbi:MAG TPA: hypothetical protein VG734_19820 [Lacunisphaera sp.]|nr:hypothetical protein [Lacunisphaera sp.]